jgi:hypothetical protein
MAAWHSKLLQATMSSGIAAEQEQSSVGESINSHVPYVRSGMIAIVAIAYLNSNTRPFSVLRTTR